MKSASEWLASSDDDSVASKKTPVKPSGGITVRRRSRTPSPSTQSLTIPESDSPTNIKKKNAAAENAAAARAREAEERKKRQEEIRKRMKATLGAATVETITTAVSADVAANKKASSVFTSDDSGSGVAGAMRDASGVLPPRVGDASLLGRRASWPALTSLPPHLEEVEIMVADRGTQTVDHASCQTDPEPRVLHCSQCYHDYYGHTPEAPACPHGLAYGAGTDSGSSNEVSDPLFAALMQRAGVVMNGRRIAGATGARTGSSRSSGNNGRDGAADYMFTAMQSTAMLREQLFAVQNSIDMLISRYNLPPPPAAA